MATSSVLKKFLPSKKQPTPVKIQPTPTKSTPANKAIAKSNVSPVLQKFLPSTIKQVPGMPISKKNVTTSSNNTSAKLAPAVIVATKTTPLSQLIKPVPVPLTAQNLISGKSQAAVSLPNIITRKVLSGTIAKEQLTNIVEGTPQSYAENAEIDRVLVEAQVQREATIQADTAQQKQDAQSGSLFGGAIGSFTSGLSLGMIAVLGLGALLILKK